LRRRSRRSERDNTNVTSERLRIGLVAAYVVGLGVSITLAETALVLLALRFIIRLARGETRGSWPLKWPILAFIAATLLAASLSGRPAESLWSARSVVHLLGLWVIVDALPDVGAVTRALAGLLAVLALVSIVGIGQVALCVQLAPWAPVLGRVALKCHRAHGFYSIYMTLAGVLSLVLLAVLPWLMEHRSRWRTAAWLVSLFALAVTYVRGAWLGFAAGVVVLAAVARRRRGLLLGGLVLATIALLLVPGVRSRARSIVDPNDPTSSERVYMWHSGIAMARDHWLTGVGPAQVKRVYPDYAAAEVTHKSRGHLHNTPLQIFIERGLLGFLAWLSIFAAFFTRAVRIVRRVDGERRAIVAGAISAVTGFLVGGLTEHNFGDTEVLMVALLVMAGAFVVERAEIGAPRESAQVE
jgi:putative inorganic carbon (HCO3(-)) transporter